MLSNVRLSRWDEVLPASDTPSAARRAVAVSSCWRSKSFGCSKDSGTSAV